MPNLGPLELLIGAVVLALLVLEAIYWIIRLAVRSGVNDALRTNRQWLERRDDDSAVTAPQ